MHTHILFDVDHGIRKEEKFIEMLDIYSQLGFEAIVCTPHIFNPWVVTNVENIRDNMNKATLAASNRGIRLYLGSELFVGSQLKLKAIPFKNRYVLCEFNPNIRPLHPERKLKQLSDQGLEIIIAHVERYKWLKPDDEICNSLRHMGCFFQANAEAVANGKVSEYLERDLIDFFGSDNHGDKELPGILRDVIREYPIVESRMEALDL